MALAELNNSDKILPIFKLVPNDVNLGVVMYVAPFADKVFKSKLNSLGVSMFGVVMTDVAYGVLSLEKKY
jgi:hypothetical protein